MKIKVNEQIHLSPIHDSDKTNLVKYINHPEVANNTLTIPHPYHEADADFFFNLIKEKKEKIGKTSNWAIRNATDEFIGSIGLSRKDFDGNPHRDQFGYWLAEPYWGKGIMTEVVKSFSDYCFENENLHRLEATVFHYNPGSMRVLEKAGFEKEGNLKKAYFKNGNFLDGILYAKIKK